jgi:hypothetical protein
MAEEPKTITESSKKKYTQATDRIEAAKLDLNKPAEVLAWIRTKGGNSAQRTYLSAIKYKLGKEYHKEYAAEMRLLMGQQIDKDDKQELTEKQKENYIPYNKLVEIQQGWADKENKTEEQWKSYVIASLYTLNAPVRSDYGEVRVFGRTDPRRSKGNELIWRKKKPVFIFREYKTKSRYGDVTIPLSKGLTAVIGEWFKHLGKTPKYLLDAKLTSNYLLGEIQDAFISTGKKVGVDILRHSYIQHHLPPIATNTEKRKELAGRMLHSIERQQAYYSQNV